MHDGTPLPLKALADVAGLQLRIASTDHTSSEQKRSWVPVGFWPRADWPTCLTNVSAWRGRYFGAL